MSQLAGYGAAIYAASQTSLTFANEAMTDAGDHINYTITNANKRYWDRAVAVVVQESTDSGSTWHTAAAAYTLQPCGGKVIFATGNNASYLYRTSGNYLPITQIGNGHEWSVNVNLTLAKSTVFGSGWAQNTAIIGDASAQIMQYWIDNYFFNALTAGNVIIVALYVNAATGARYEAFAFVNKDQIKTPENALVDGTLDLMIDGTLFYNPGP